MSLAGMHPSRAWLGNALVLALLGIAAWSLLPAGGEWWLATPRPSRWWLAGACLVTYGALCLWWLRGARPARVSLPVGDTRLPWLVVHASQTGFAAELAQRTAEALLGAGQAPLLLPLQALDLATLRRAERALFIASTTGEGDPPDPALAFVRDAMGTQPDLSGLRYAVLALGDRSYGHYCAFGHQLAQWLHRSRAQALFDLTEVDNGDPGALRHWQHHLSVAAGGAAMDDWTRPGYDTWTLAGRQLLNPGSQGGPVHLLSLHPPDSGVPHWQAGDIAEIGPRHDAAQVERWLQAHGHDGNAPVVWQSARMPLREALVRLRLDAPDMPTPADAQSLVDALPALPHREYSIASIPGERHLQLLVRLMQAPDGTPGLGSGWLCRHAPVGGPVELRIRSNPNFHPPAAGSPLVLVGNGTGIAGLRALLKAREASGDTRNWLLFGERQRSHDAFFGDELARWQAQGLLRADFAWSRDGGPHRYVQDLLRAHADTLRAWVDEGACLYVCGSLAGMAPGVDAALREVLGDAVVEQLRERGRYRRDVY